MIDFLELFFESIFGIGELVFDADSGKFKKDSIPHFIAYTAAAICIIFLSASAWKAIHRISAKTIDNQI